MHIKSPSIRFIVFKLFTVLIFVMSFAEISFAQPRNVAGRYTVTGYFFHPSSPRAISNTKTLIQVSANTYQTDLGDLGASGYRFQFSIDANNNVINWVALNSAPQAPASGLMTLDNPVGISTYPGTTTGFVSSTYNNKYDPSTKTLYLHYGYQVGGTSQNQYQRQVYEKYVMIPSPVITSFTPTSGSSGSVVLLRGYNFTGSTAVSFGGVNAASFNVRSDTVITATVGNGLTGVVSVTNTYGTGIDSGFIYTGPVISNIYPSTATTGQTVTIEGANLDLIDTVKFGGVNANAISLISSTKITAVVGSGASGNVFLSSLFGKTTFPGFRYGKPPTITSLSSYSGTVGTSIYIKGNNFIASLTGNIVYFGAVKANVTAATTTQLTVTVPVSSSYQPVTVNAGGLIAYSSKPFNVTFTNKSPIDTFSFSPKVSLITNGDSPNSTNVSDLDGDGKPDIIVANYGSNTISIFRNISTKGNTIFAPPVTLNTGSSPNAVYTEDLNGDGKLDIVVANYSGSTISVYKNYSTINNLLFSIAIDYFVSSNPYAVTIKDIDGDGKPDIIATNTPIGSVSVLKNNSNLGGMSFGSSFNFNVGSSPDYIATGDIDGDGLTDLIVSNYVDSTVSVLKNISTNGYPNFSAMKNFNVGVYPYSVQIADMDGDGKLDIVACNNGGNNISVLRNTTTSGTINFSNKLDFNTDISPKFIAIADIDGDGKPDIVNTNCDNSTTISVFKNISTAGNISFNTMVNFYSGISPYGISIADFDGDNKPDIVSSNNDGTISIFRNKLSEPVISSFTPTNGGGGTAILIQGINLLGATSVTIGGVPVTSFTVISDAMITATIGNGATGAVSVTTTYGTGTLEGFIHNGPRISSFAPTTGVAGTIVVINGQHFTGLSSVSFGGVSAQSYTVINDSLMFAVVGNGATGDLKVSSANGSSSIGNFIYSLIPTISAVSPLFGAIGTTVTITGTNFNTTPANNIVYFGDIKATVISSTATAIVTTVPSSANYKSITVTNNNLTAYYTQPFSNTFSGGTGSFNSLSFGNRIDSTVGLNPAASVLADFDGDGRLDIAVVSISSANVSILRNTSTSSAISYASKVDVTSGASPYGVVPGDLNGDGKPDLVILNSSDNNASVYFNNSTVGNLSFNFVVNLTTGNLPQSASIVDIDGDGRPDLAIANGYDSIISIFRNNSTLTKIAFNERMDFVTGRSAFLSAPSGLGFGDLNGDGKPDLVVGNQGDSIISVFKNISTNGKIMFDTRLNYMAGSGAIGIGIADLDGDGKPDIAVSNSGSNTVSLFKNNGVGTAISFANAVNIVTGNQPWYITVADLNGDGKIDIATSNFGDSSFSVLKNNSTSGNFAFASPQAYKTLGNTNGIAIGDLDGDGKSDVVVPFGSNKVSIFKNNIVGASISISGNVRTANGNAIKGVSIVVAGSANTNKITDAQGGFNFGSLNNGDYYIKATKNNDVSKANGVSTIDAALVQSHILQKSQLNNPYKIIAADVNGDNKVSALDIVFLKRLILGLDTTFTKAVTGEKRLWVFADSNYTITSPLSPFPYKDSLMYIGLSANKTNQTFIGMKLGDVNWDWNPAVAKPNDHTIIAVDLSYDAIHSDKDNLVRIPVKVKNFKDMMGMQFTLGFNAEALIFKGMENNILNIETATNHTNEGKLSMLWLDPKNEVKTLEDGSVMMTLVFERKGKEGIGIQNTLDLNNDITMIEAFDKDYQLHSIIMKPTAISLEQTTKGNFVVSPNPIMNGLIHVQMNLKENKAVVLNLIDNLGKIVLTKKVEGFKGWNQFTINQTKQILPGIYYLKAEGIEAVKQVIIGN